MIRLSGLCTFEWIVGLAVVVVAIVTVNNMSLHSVSVADELLGLDCPEQWWPIYRSNISISGAQDASDVMRAALLVPFRNRTRIDEVSTQEPVRQSIVVRGTVIAAWVLHLRFDYAVDDYGTVYSRTYCQ